MRVDRDYDGWHQWCLQCGYRHDLIDMIKVRPKDRVRMNIKS